jgi:hypothetical protein
MRQLEIDYFWPLTEQIPLGLNYEGCEKPKLTTPIDTNGITYTVGAWNTGNVCITASHLNLDIDTTVVKVKEKPNLCSRIIYNCLGLKWEKK